MKYKPWNELCRIARSAPYGFVHGSAESHISSCYKIGVENEGKEGYGGNIQTNVKERQLEYSIWEYMVTDVFQVGNVTVKLVGKEHEECKTECLGEVDGKPKYKRTPTGKMRGKYYMFRSQPLEAIDVFKIDHDNTQHPIEEYKYCTREEIIELAQKHSRIMEERCEKVTVLFPTGNIYASNFFCEKNEERQGFDDLPKDIKYNSEFSINHAVGREATAQWLADNRHMAYGQLGNTYCSVWKINDNKLVVTQNDPYVEDEEGYETELPAPEGWEFVGGICCDVWRVELVDEQGMVDYGFDVDKFRNDFDHKEVHRVQVNPGKWEMKTYYQQRSDKEIIEEFGYPIWAELNRKD